MKNSSTDSNKSVTRIIEEVCEKIYNNYCKYPEKYTRDEWDEVFDSICYDCPLNRL